MDANPQALRAEFAAALAEVLEDPAAVTELRRRYQGLRHWLSGRSVPAAEPLDRVIDAYQALVRPISATRRKSLQQRRREAEVRPGPKSTTTELPSPSERRDPLLPPEAGGWPAMRLGPFWTQFSVFGSLKPIDPSNIDVQVAGEGLGLPSDLAKLTAGLVEHMRRVQGRKAPPFGDFYDGGVFVVAAPPVTQEVPRRALRLLVRRSTHFEKTVVRDSLPKVARDVVDPLGDQRFAVPLRVRSWLAENDRFQPARHPGFGVEVSVVSLGSEPKALIQYRSPDLTTNPGRITTAASESFNVGDFEGGRLDIRSAVRRALHEEVAEGMEVADEQIKIFGLGIDFGGGGFHRGDQGGGFQFLATVFVDEPIENLRVRRGRDAHESRKRDVVPLTAGALSDWYLRDRSRWHEPSLMSILAALDDVTAGGMDAFFEEVTVRSGISAR